MQIICEYFFEKSKNKHYLVRVVWKSVHLNPNMENTHAQTQRIIKFHSQRDWMSMCKKNITKPLGIIKMFAGRGAAIIIIR